MQTRKVDIVVIGAGIAGLSFARTMQQHGRDVLILERSRALGGRCATWRHADIAMDYGVPFLHARSPLFWQTVDQLLGADVLSGWPQRVQGNGPTCQPRALDPGVRHAAARGGLNTLAKKLAEDLEILRESEVTSLKTIHGGVQLSGANFSLSTQTLVLAGANGESLRLLKDSDFGQPTVANVTSLLDYLNWNGFGVAPQIWMSIVLAAMLVIAALMNFTRRDIAYTAVILWALVGISVKHAAVPAVALPTWMTFGLVALTLVITFFLPQGE